MNRSRCNVCRRPIANEEDWRDIPPGEGVHLCWCDERDCKEIREQSERKEANHQRALDEAEGRIDLLKQHHREELHAFAIALLDCLSQGCTHYDDCSLGDGGLSAYARGLELAREHGFARYDGRGYVLVWPGD